MPGIFFNYKEYTCRIRLRHLQYVLLKHKLLKSSVTISFPDVRKVFFQSELVQDFLKTNLSVFATNNLLILVNKMKRSNKRHDSSKGLKKRARSGSERVKIVFITRLVPNLPRFFHSSVTIALSITALCITRTERLEKTRLKRNVGQINILRKKSNHIALIIDSMQ